MMRAVPAVDGQPQGLCGGRVGDRHARAQAVDAPLRKTGVLIVLRPAAPDRGGAEVGVFGSGEADGDIEHAIDGWAKVLRLKGPGADLRLAEGVGRARAGRGAQLVAHEGDG